MSVQEIRSQLKSLANSKIAEHSQKFFKTGKGEYGEGDIFLGIRVPELRKIAKSYFKEISYSDVTNLFKSKYHEERLLAGLMLVYKSQKAVKADDYKELEKSYKCFVRNLKHINNWDIVDTTCRDVVGAYLYTIGDTSQLYKWSKAKAMWTRRIAIVSTYYLIKNKQLDETFEIAETLLEDSEDLMHKATGWMLREAGKIDQKRLEKFLFLRAKVMPRTMLRYAIERLPEKTRKRLMAV